MKFNYCHVTNPDFYYDWELSIKTKPSDLNKKKQNKKNQNICGIYTEDFRRFIKLWKSKNIAF